MLYNLGTAADLFIVTQPIFTTLTTHFLLLLFRACFLSKYSANLANVRKVTEWPTSAMKKLVIASPKC